MSKRISTMFFPLEWPSHLFREDQNPVQSRFDQTMHSARTLLEKELDALSADDICISTNWEVLRSGSLKVTKKEPADTGVAVYFTMGGQQKVLACDKWNAVRDNLYAIALTLERMRAIERYGCTDILGSIFYGLDALPETAGGALVWHEVLEVAPDAPKEEIEKAFRRKLIEFHPDKNGGDQQRWDELMALPVPYIKMER